MKHGRKPTKQQAILMTEWGLNYRNWLVVKDTPDEMVVVHRHSDKNVRTIKRRTNNNDY